MASDISHKLDQVLEEIRIVVPGTQALLGFQFAAVFQNGFEHIPDLVKDVHFLSLLTILVAVLCLMSPVAFHRISEDGKSTRRIYELASRMLTVGM